MGADEPENAQREDVLPSATHVGPLCSPRRTSSGILVAGGASVIVTLAVMWCHVRVIPLILHRRRSLALLAQPRHHLHLLPETRARLVAQRER